MANALAKKNNEEPAEGAPAQEQPQGKPLTAVQQFQKQVTAEVNIVRGQLKQLEGQFLNALPRHMPVERFERVVLTAVQNNPDLMFKCSRQSLFNACMRAAQDGLLPDGREGAIVPFGPVAQWLPMIFGLRKKARNSGEIIDWDVHLVHEKDEFDYALGDNAFIFHKPFFGVGGRGAVLGGYSIARLKIADTNEVGISREVMTIDEIEGIRKQSSRAQSKDSPWNVPVYYPEMCRKTIARRHVKSLPMSSDLDDLIRRDDEVFALETAKTQAEQQGAVEQRPARPGLGAALDALASGGLGDDQPITDAQPGEQQASAESPAQSPAPDAAAGAAAAESAAPAKAPESENPAPQPPAQEAKTPEPPKTEPAKTDAKKKTESAEPKLPTTENDYKLFAKTWIDSTKTAPALRERWQNIKEKNLRNTCNVSPDARESIYEYLLEIEKKLLAATP